MEEKKKGKKYIANIQTHLFFLGVSQFYGAAS